MKPRKRAPASADAHRLKHMDRVLLQRRHLGVAVGDCGARGVSRGLLGTPYYQSLVGGVSESHKHGVKIHFKCTSVHPGD